MEFVKEIIELMKENLIKRTSPLTLIFWQTLNIKTVVRIIRILENNNSLDSKLLFKFENVEKEDDLLEAITEISHEKHPILHKYISLLP